MAKKDHAMKVMMDQALKDQFFAVCEGIDRPPSQVIRELMRDFLRANAQGDLLHAAAPKARRGRK